MGYVLLQLGVRVPHRWAVAGAQHVEVVAHAQPRQRQQVAGHRTPVGADEDAAVAEHSIAGEARALGYQRVVVGGVPGRGDGLQRAEAHTFAELDVDGAAPRGERRGMACEQRLHGVGVVVVVVCQRHAAQPAAILHGRDHVLDVLGQVRSRIDHPCGVAPEDPCVRPRQRQRAGVGRAHEPDVVMREQIRARRGLGVGAVLRAWIERVRRPHGSDVS